MTWAIFFSENSFSVKWSHTFIFVSCVEKINKIRSCWRAAFVQFVLRLKFKVRFDSISSSWLPLGQHYPFVTYKRKNVKTISLCFWLKVIWSIFNTKSFTFRMRFAFYRRFYKYLSFHNFLMTIKNANHDTWHINVASS